MKPDCNTPAARPVTKRVDWIVTIVPFLCILVLKLLPIEIDPVLKAILILMSALPAASSQTILAEQYGTNTADAGRAIFITTLFCVVTIPIAMVFVV